MLTNISIKVNSRTSTKNTILLTLVQKFWLKHNKRNVGRCYTKYVTNERVRRVAVSRLAKVYQLGRRCHPLEKSLYYDMGRGRRRRGFVVPLGSTNQVRIQATNVHFPVLCLPTRHANSSRRPPGNKVQTHRVGRQRRLGEVFLLDVQLLPKQAN